MAVIEIPHTRERLRSQNTVKPSENSERVSEFARQASNLAIVINPGLLFLEKRADGSLRKHREAASEIASRLKSSGFLLAGHIRIVAIFHSKQKVARPPADFIASSKMLAHALDSEGRLIEVDELDRAQQPCDGSDALWKPVADFVKYKTLPNEAPTPNGSVTASSLIAIAGARTAREMLGFEAGSPEDIALHPGACLLSQGIDEGSDHIAWRQVPFKDFQ